jgi:hypothetical protein
MGDDSLSFEDDIKLLFRDRDRAAMEWAFDLWDYGAVKENAPQILERLQDGDMPCDGSWPEEQVATFRRWVEAGTPP